MIIKIQSSRITEQETTIRELRSMIDELRSIKVNLEEALEEFRCQFWIWVKDLQEQKRRIEADVIMDAYLKSGKSLDEIMMFLNP